LSFVKTIIKEDLRVRGENNEEVSCGEKEWALGSAEARVN
jgi:hypothetical protein